MASTARGRKIRIGLADEEERSRIYRLRHEVYARELAQHQTNGDGQLTDALDEFNTYVTLTIDDRLVGFVSVTPPPSNGHGGYSIDKYLSRGCLPLEFDDHLFEVRLLTVIPEHRHHSHVVGLLMWGALRWIEERGGSRIVAIGRREVLDLYTKVGFEPMGIEVRSGAVRFELMNATTDALRRYAQRFQARLHRLRRQIEWDLDIPFDTPPPCYHGGAFFHAVGPRFDDLDRRRHVINADVLDAWFDPSPRVLAALREHLPWLLRTSPPTGCEGMVDAIAEARGVHPACVLPGAGSSDLIFRILPRWLHAGSHVLILDPMYGEYAHVLEHVVGCRVDRLTLHRSDGYQLDMDELAARLQDRYDLVVLVNPNSPTGRYADRDGLRHALETAPADTRIWIDETYIEYVGSDHSLEPFAASSGNAVVCKSMSKVYALSGARAAYLVGPQPLIDPLRSVTPPWAVSLPAQLAAVEALRDPAYYAGRYRQTCRLREHLADQLRDRFAMDITPGVANFLLCHLPPGGPTAARLVEKCREHNLFLRDASNMGAHLGRHTARIAVKDEATNSRMIEILDRVLNGN